MKASKFEDAVGVDAENGRKVEEILAMPKRTVWKGYGEFVRITIIDSWGSSCRITPPKIPQPTGLIKQLGACGYTAILLETYFPLPLLSSYC